MSQSSSSPHKSPLRKIDLSLTPLILRLTLPIAATSQLENLVGIADIYMVGKLGPDAISAVGISRQITMVVGVMMMAVTTDAFTMVAQAIGAGSQRDASATAKQAFTLVIFRPSRATSPPGNSARASGKGAGYRLKVLRPRCETSNVKREYCHSQLFCSCKQYIIIVN